MEVPLQGDHRFLRGRHASLHFFWFVQETNFQVCFIWKSVAKRKKNLIFSKILFVGNLPAH
jgi:hypothetical protein